MIFRDGDFKKVVPVADTFDASEHAVSINANETKYLGRILGKPLLAELIGYAANEEPSNEEIAKYEELLVLCQLAIGNITFSDKLQGQSVLISQGAITVRSSENEKSASDSRLNALREELRNTGFNALESVLGHLHANSETFTTFQPVPRLLPTLDAFEQYNSLSGSMLSFMALQPIIKRLEQSIKEMLTPTLYAVIVALPDSDDTVKQDVKYYACSYLALASAAAGMKELPVKVGEMGVFIYPFSESLAVSTRRPADNAYIESASSTLKTAAESSRAKLERLLKDNAEELGLDVPTSSSEALPFSPSNAIVVA